MAMAFHRNELLASGWTKENHDHEIPKDIIKIIKAFLSIIINVLIEGQKFKNIFSRIDALLLTGSGIYNNCQINIDLPSYTTQFRVEGIISIISIHTCWNGILFIEC